MRNAEGKVLSNRMATHSLPFINCRRDIRNNPFLPLQIPVRQLHHCFFMNIVQLFLKASPLFLLLNLYDVRRFYLSFSLASQGHFSVLIPCPYNLTPIFFLDFYMVLYGAFP